MLSLVKVLNLNYNLAKFTNDYLMSITEIKDAVMRLSPDELREFVEWIDELQDIQWDKQIAEDLRSGKLDSLIEEAKTEFKEGKCRKI